MATKVNAREMKRFRIIFLKFITPEKMADAATLMYHLKGWFPAKVTSIAIPKVSRTYFSKLCTDHFNCRSIRVSKGNPGYRLKIYLSLEERIYAQIKAC